MSHTPSRRRDTQQTDTYYIVAHFHYVLFGGAILGIFAGLYYWWPKMFGKMLNEKLGKWNFWLMVIGMNLTFGPMHILGLQGQPRRMVVWSDKLMGDGFFNLAFWNQVATVGSFIIALGVFLFIVNVWHTTRKGAAAPLDPWDARSLEWLTNSPPKEHNFDVIPHVHALDEYFHMKYEEVDTEAGPRLGQDEDRRGVACGAGGSGRQAHPHAVAVVLADPAGFSLPVMGYGIIYNRLLAVVGGVILLLAIFGWALEPATADESDYDPPPQGGDPMKELANV